LAVVFAVANIISNLLGLFRGVNIVGEIIGIVISGLIASKRQLFFNFGGGNENGDNPSIPFVPVIL
jgi:hypothetical protein